LPLAPLIFGTPFPIGSIFIVVAIVAVIIIIIITILKVRNLCQRIRPVLIHHPPPQKALHSCIYTSSPIISVQCLYCFKFLYCCYLLPLFFVLLQQLALKICGHGNRAAR
jgi:hypothetical protein